MTQADRVYITPPTNTSAIDQPMMFPPVDPTRRRFLAVAAVASVVSAGTLAAATRWTQASPRPSRCRGWRDIHAVSLGHLDWRPSWLGLEPGRKTEPFPSACFSVTPKIMKKSIKVTPKKRRGRPATGRDPHVTSRMPPELIAEVEAWAVTNDTSRSDAFRRLVELGLSNGKRWK